MYFDDAMLAIEDCEDPGDEHGHNAVGVVVFAHCQDCLEVDQLPKSVRKVTLIVLSTYVYTDS